MSLLDLARRAAPVYAAIGKVSAVLAAGSVGRGRADAYSDLELDVYWRVPPADADRLGVITELGATLSELWPYEQDEWSEEYRLLPDVALDALRTELAAVRAGPRPN